MRSLFKYCVLALLGLFGAVDAADAARTRPHHNAHPIAHRSAVAHRSAATHVIHAKHRAKKPSAHVWRAPAPLHAPAAYAAPVAAPAPAPAPSAARWLVTVNAKLIVSPDYPGAARYSVIGFPTLSFRHPGDPQIWTSPDDHISLPLYKTPLFALGPVLSYSGGRYDMINPVGPLKGVHDVLWTLDAGLFAEVWLLPDTLRARGEIRHGFRGADGFVATLGGDWVSHAGRFTFGLGPRLNFGDGKFMNEVFGVTAADAVAMPVFTPYRPSGGLYSAGLYASATYKQSEQWSYTVQGGYNRLTGQAAASPIVGVSGSTNQWIVGATASYTFELQR
jgi:outer membrane scaffolding protein for murein synthesis (MipA/OmpV family)